MESADEVDEKELVKLEGVVGGSDTMLERLNINNSQPPFTKFLVFHTGSKCLLTCSEHGLPVTDREWQLHTQPLQYLPLCWERRKMQIQIQS